MENPEERLDEVPAWDKEAELFFSAGEIDILLLRKSEHSRPTFSQVNHQGHPAIMVRGKPKLIRQVAVEADGHLAKQVMVLSHKKFLRLNSKKFNC